MIRAFLLVLGPPSSIAGTKFKTQVYSGQSPIHSLQHFLGNPQNLRAPKTGKSSARFSAQEFA
jgi:hypothetical protein